MLIIFDTSGNYQITRESFSHWFQGFYEGLHHLSQLQTSPLASGKNLDYVQF